MATVLFVNEPEVAHQTDYSLRSASRWQAPVAVDPCIPKANPASRPTPRITPDSLSPRRIAAWTLSLILHTGLFGLLAGKDDPRTHLLVAASDSSALIVEFLPSAPMVEHAPEPDRVEPRPEKQHAIERITNPKPSNPPIEAVALTDTPLPPELPEPVTAVAAESQTSEPGTPTATPIDRTLATKPPTFATEAPLTARGKRAQTQYLRELMAWLAKHRVYPAEARKQKVQGVVQVRFLIDRDGRLLSAAIQRSAQSRLLDDAAIDVLRRANPMPAFPEALDRQRLSVSLPIDFSLVTD